MEANTFKSELKCWRESVDSLSPFLKKIYQTCSNEKGNNGRVFIQAPPTVRQEIHLGTLT